MRKFIFIWTITVLLIGCKDHFDVGRIISQQKLVVYCFPTVTDTTWINVSMSLPVNQKGKPESVSDARITYLLNGQPQQVTPKGNGLYYTVCRQKTGDRIELSVEKDGMDAATASTSIPEAVKVKADTVVKVRVYNSYYEQTEDYEQLAATFADAKNTKNFYAVRVQQKAYNGEGIIRKGNTTWSLNYYDPADKLAEWYWGDSVHVWSPIGTESEPLLHPTSKIDDAFGFDNNFYQNFYIFNDPSINGKTYTMHLNLKDYTSAHGGFQFFRRYRCVLYHITPELYRFVKSINDIENNKLAKAGMSQLPPTYTNVIGGAGVVAGYNSYTSAWKDMITGKNLFIGDDPHTYY